MKIIDEAKSISAIISLIESAEKYVVIVSPYTDLKGWDKLKNAINEASQRGIKVSYYVRKEEGVEGTEDLDVDLFEVANLHSKMFFTEQEAIIGSAHLKYNKDINWTYSLDFPNEYNDMLNFFNKNIKATAIKSR